MWCEKTVPFEIWGKDDQAKAPFRVKPCSLLPAELTATLTLVNIYMFDIVIGWCNHKAKYTVVECSKNGWFHIKHIVALYHVAIWIVPIVT